MSRSVLCADGCGRSVRLSNGDQRGVCGPCLAERGRVERLADEERQRKALRQLVRRGTVPRKFLREALG